MTYRSDLLRTLDERGFIHQGTDLDGLDAAAAAGPITGYIGFDATADSLHAGSLVQIMLLYWLQRTGHRPIALMGGGTTKVGDPSGKDETRKLLDDEGIRANIAGIRRHFEAFLTFGDGATDAVMVNNDDWLAKLSYVGFLREYGRHFTINRMLTFDSVKLRLDREQPLTFLEFNYMLMQAYDFHVLHERHGCQLQMGGSDQWGNIVNGVELIRRLAAGEERAPAFGLTTPLLTTASGKKMGKTESGAVWLSPDKLPPYDYWQYWRNTEDADVERMLGLFTALPMDEVRRLGALSGRAVNDAKIVLATEATAMLHGREAAERAQGTAAATFAGGAGDDLPSVAAALPVGVVQALRDLGLAASNGEARRHIKAGAVRVNGAAISEERDLTEADLDQGQVRLSVGKKKHGIVRPA